MKIPFKLLKAILSEYWKGGNYSMKFNSQNLKELVNVYGPSGNENRIREYIERNK